jgi:iron complex transport system substrate-binding protein
MRIVSLLPSLTELVAFLGRADDLVGVTHECDWPPGIASLPHLTRSLVPAASSSGEIDRLVSEQGGLLYELDEDLLASLRPDLILTQAQCDVCAVNERTVLEAAARLPGRPRVETVNPTTLPEVFGMFLRVGDLIGRREEAERLVASFTDLAEEVSRRCAGRPRPRVVHLEWTDPPYNSGHWGPELVSLAGGEEVLGRTGVPSRRASWEELAAARPDVVLVAPCGFSLGRVEQEWELLRERPEWRALKGVRRVALVDGNAYFSRPGPRLLESLAIAAAAIGPDRCHDLAPARGWRLIDGAGP